MQRSGRSMPSPHREAHHRRWWHIQRGSTYEEVARGRLQTAHPLGDNAPLVIYRSEDDGRWYARGQVEFEDGRFQEIAADPEWCVGERRITRTNGSILRAVAQIPGWVIAMSESRGGRPHLLAYTLWVSLAHAPSMECDDDRG